ncbi:MAG TPA: ABC transporter permease [Thermoanaerobaculia bacterium]|nr:ABC transporter permease [Thermoanaerobaculia bacterium]
MWGADGARLIRAGCRRLRNDLGYVVAGTLCVGLGIGALAVSFTVVQGTLLSPLPYPEADRLVTLWCHFDEQGIAEDFLSEVELLDYARQSRALELVSGVLPWRFNLTKTAEPEQLVGARVSVGLLALLGAQPLLGRTFSPDDAVPGKDHVVLLSESLWRRRFGGSKDILKQELELNGSHHQVVGVLPQGVRLGEDEWDVWAPLATDTTRLPPRNARGLLVLGRMRPGVTLAAARAEALTISNRFASAYPDDYPSGSGWQLRLVPLKEHIVGEAKPAFLLQLATCALIFLAACGNVFSLSLARAATRIRETAIRAALGAPRGALRSSFLFETTAVALLGALLGLSIAGLVIHLLVVAGPRQVPRLDELRVGLPTLALALALAVVAGVVLGWIAAGWAHRHAGWHHLRDASELAAMSRSSQRIQGGLVVLQVALALVVLISTGLLTKSYLRTLRVNPGFEPDRVLSFQLFLPRAGYPPPAAVAFFRDLEEELRTLPGVRHVASVSDLPFTDSDSNGQVSAESSPEATTDHQGAAVSWRTVTPDYFETLRIPIERGRAFDGSDQVETQAVVIVDPRLAARLWPGQDPLGKRLRLLKWANSEWLTVVGVVGAVRDASLTLEPREQLYLPHAQRSRRMMSLVLSTELDPMSLAPAVQRRVRQLAADLPIVNLVPLNQLIAASTARARFNLWVFALSTGVTVVLAVLGLYALAAYAVAQSRREIGLRLALGARSGDVLRMALGRILVLVSAGLATGGLVSLWTSRLFQSQLFEVAPLDGTAWLVAPLLLISAGSLAVLGPARRALSVSPITALRQGSGWRRAG